jgi:hypothetical protein
MDGIFSPCVPFRIRAMLDIMYSLMRLRAKERGPKASLNQSLSQSLKGGPSTLPSAAIFPLCAPSVFSVSSVLNKRREECRKRCPE